MLVVTHMCMAAMPGISLYSYINLKLVTIVFLILSHVFLDKFREQESKTGSSQKLGRGGPKQCIHME
jgi:hypothetical protein